MKVKELIEALQDFLDENMEVVIKSGNYQYYIDKVEIGKLRDKKGDCVIIQEGEQL